MHLRYRHEILHLVKENGIGIELGVAQGEFAERILKQERLSEFYGVDKYDDHHNEKEYLNTLKRLMKYKNYTLHRMTFDDALQLFPDEYFDFIYIDGYAHTGQENGQTLYKWYNKCKSGGVFSGDDYCDSYKKTVKAVDSFCSYYNLELKLIKCFENTVWSRNPTWYVIKP